MNKRRFCNRLILILMMATLCLKAEGGTPSYDVPLNNPVYDFLDLQPLPPRVGKVDVTLRPHTEAQVCSLLVFCERKVPGTDTALTRFFLRRFSRDADGLLQHRHNLFPVLFDTTRTYAVPYARTTIGYQDSNFTRMGFTPIRIDNLSTTRELANETGVGGRLYSSIGGALFYFDGVILTRYGSASRWKKTWNTRDGEYWNAIGGDSTGASHLMGYEEFAASSKLPVKWFDMKLGIDHVQWGPARSSGLFLSGEGYPLLHVKLDRRFGPLAYSFVLGKLIGDSMEAERVLYAKRLSYAPVEWLSLGFSDGVTVPDAKIEPLYLMPFVPFYFTEHYRGSPDNRFMSFDGKVLIDKKIDVYGELFLDDLNGLLGIFKNDKFGDKWAGLLGMNWYNPLPLVPLSRLNAQFVQIEPWVYTTSVAQEQNLPVHFGRVLGNQLGPHTRSLSADLTCRFSRLEGSFGIRQFWKGEGPGSSVFDENPPDTTFTHWEWTHPRKDYRFTTFARNRTVFSAEVNWFFSEWLLFGGSGALALERQPKTTQFQVGVNARVNY